MDENAREAAAQALLTVREWAFKKSFGIEIPEGSQPTPEVFHKAGQIQAYTQMIFWIDTLTDPDPAIRERHAAVQEYMAGQYSQLPEARPGS